MKVIFLDFDGVIRVPIEHDSHEADFCQHRMRMLALVCKSANAKIVVSSDWRCMNNRDVIAGHLSPFLEDLLHPEWRTPLCGHRWQEVERWLKEHSYVTRYAILEDWAKHFDGCPLEMKRRIVLCNNRHGLVPRLAERTIDLLNN